MTEQLARGSFTGFDGISNPFSGPNAMPENIRRWDDHLGLYTRLPPQPVGTPLPAEPVNGDGQIFADGTYATFNGGSWKVYEPRRGIHVVLFGGGDFWENTGSGWTSFADILANRVADGALEAIQPSLDAANNSAMIALGLARSFPTTEAALSNGVVGLIVNNISGPDGTYDLTFTGGSGQKAAAKLVNAGGTTTFILRYSGFGYLTAPAASAPGLTLDTTVVIAPNCPPGTFFSTPVANDELDAAIIYESQGATAVERARVPTAAAIGAAAAFYTGVQAALIQQATSLIQTQTIVAQHHAFA